MIQKKLRRASPNWITGLANYMLQKAGGWDAFSIRKALVEADLWHRMEVAGMVESVDEGERSMHLTREQKVKKLLDQLYKKGMSGDTSAVKSYMELSSQTETKSAFDVHIDIQNYKIADKSLANIVMDADEKPVGEILKAFVERCRIDNFPKEITDDAEALFTRWVAVAEVKFKDVVDVPVLATKKDDDDDPFVDAEQMDRALEKIMAEEVSA